MDDKKFNLFSKALLILWNGYCEENGVEAIGSRVVVVDDEDSDFLQKKPAAISNK